VGPGNLPTQTLDAALFCEGKLGSRFVQNILNAKGEVVETLRWRKAQVCNKQGANTRNIKVWARYWFVVLEKVMPRIRSRVHYIDMAHYGRYQDVELRNEWVVERSTDEWGFAKPPALVAWELAGPDRRVSIPPDDSKAAQREVALELPKRIALAFATGSAGVTWFHNAFNDRAAVGVRFTSLKDADGKKTAVFWNYRLFVNQVAGAKTATLERIDPEGKDGGAYLVHFGFANGKRVIVAWAVEGSHPTTIAVDGTTAQVIEATGRRTPPTKTNQAPGGELNLTLTEVPVFVID
jgi:hypothetical protein